MFFEYFLRVKMNESVSAATTETMAEISDKVAADESFNGSEITKEKDSNLRENLKGFLPLIAITQMVGLLPILLIIYWVFYRAGGLVHCVLKMSNWHIILSSISFVYMMGNAILIFRILRNWPKNTLKKIHALVGGVNGVIAIVSIWAAFDFHARAGIADLYSVHSWIGMTTLVMYITQIVVGLYAFLYPRISANSRALLMPYHRFAGLVLFALAVVSAVTGINEKAIFKLGKCYQDKEFEGNLLNMCSILFTLFAIGVIYIASNLDYKRYPRVEDALSNPNPGD